MTKSKVRDAFRSVPIVDSTSNSKGSSNKGKGNLHVSLECKDIFVPSAKEKRQVTKMTKHLCGLLSNVLSNVKC